MLTLRSLTDADITLMDVWLNKEYIIKWYENPADWLHEIKERHGAFSFIKHFIVMEGETPIGFCQYYDCFYAKEYWYTVDKQNDTFSVDYLIGEEAYLNKGYGKTIVALLTDTIKNNESCNRIIVQPDQDNIASNKVLIANGYTYDKQKKYYCKLLGRV